MSAPSQRADRAEIFVARALGAERGGGSRKGESVADVLPVRLPNGELVVCEVKSRPRAPVFVVDTIEQARAHSAAAIPLGVIKPHEQGEPVVSLYFADFCRLVGLVPSAQLVLALGPAKGGEA